MRRTERKKTKRNEAKLSSDYKSDPLDLLEHWADRTAEARATVTRVLNSDNAGQSEGLSSPSYISDPLILLEYWAARTAEARARAEQHLALAGLKINMEIALTEASEMVGRLDEALKYSPEAKDTLMKGYLF